MPWKKEFGPQYEVPSVLECLVDQGILVDFSWHKDISPSFGLLDDASGREVRIYVQPILRSRREAPSLSRFLVTAGENTRLPEQEESFEELQDALEKLFEWGGELYERLGIERETPEDARGPFQDERWEDPRDFLFEALHDCHRRRPR